MDDIRSGVGIIAAIGSVIGIILATFLPIRPCNAPVPYNRAPTQPVGSILVSSIVEVILSFMDFFLVFGGRKMKMIWSVLIGGVETNILTYAYYLDWYSGICYSIKTIL